MDIDPTPGYPDEIRKFWQCPRCQSEYCIEFGSDSSYWGVERKCWNCDATSPMPWPEAATIVWHCRVCSAQNKILRSDPDPTHFSSVATANYSVVDILGVGPGKLSCPGCNTPAGEDLKGDAWWISAVWLFTGKPYDAARELSQRRLAALAQREALFDAHCRRIPRIVAARKRECAKKKQRQLAEQRRRKEATKTRRGLKRLGPVEFERAVGSLFVSLHYRVFETSTTGDRGLDLILKKSRKRVAVQCKRQEQRVGEPAVREFYGSFVGVFDSGIFITTASFTVQAQRWAEARDSLLLMDGDELVQLFCEHKPDFHNQFPKWRG